VPWRIVLAVVVLLGAGVIVFAVMRGGGSKPQASKQYTRSLPPQSADAYQRGGVPLHDDALEALLRDGLATAVIGVDRYTRALDRGDTVDPPKLAATLQALAARPEMARAKPLAAAWSALTTQLVTWSNLSPGDPALEAASEELVMRAHDVSFQLAALGLGYYLDANVSSSSRRRDAYLYAYRVEQISLVERAGEPMRVLQLRRLDKLNYSEAMFGMQGEELGDPLVLLDQIDHNVSSRDLLVLDARGSFKIGGDDWMNGSPQAIQLRANVDRAVRRELLLAMGPDAEAAAAMGALLYERSQLVLDWKRKLELRGIRLHKIDTVFLPDSLLEELATAIPKRESERAQDIEDQLAELDAAGLAGRLSEALTVSVERHEAEHGYDAEGTLPQPASIEEIVGPVEREGHKRHFAARVRNEVSAYLSQIASDPLTPHWALWTLADFAFDRDQWGGVYSNVAAIVISELARELGAPEGELWVSHGTIQRERLATLAATIAAVDGDRLRKAAASTWTRMYGSPYRPITSHAAGKR
jgi:hypothetical protein